MKSSISNDLSVGRTLFVQSKVRHAMTCIDLEISKNGGVYPFNNGRVSKYELARRANIGKTTLFSKRQKEFSNEVDQWLDNLAMPVKTPSNRRNVSELATAWKHRYIALSNSHHKTELDLQSLQVDYEQLEKEVDQLRHANRSLRDSVSRLNGCIVVPIR